MKLLSSIGSSLLSLSALLLLGTTATSPAQAQTKYKCPSGYVCIYAENAYIDTSTPSNKYYRYGTYKLYNQYNYHWVYNNQTGGASVLLCKNSNGTNCPFTLYQGQYGYYDLTPINSIKLIE
ncbi:hypothetical protein LC608_03480 [Nostoc sp. XA010]|uniref:hypothetical protein n=1 Tax=Nostoc sp. XA010 TaxID=2780407 RepID=UPI001E50D44F|nr:hypothetical protein [Nostoc sp. XA010]MCC5656060.1 hypothetical protein [Nostoc sp. XA010]